MITLSEHQAKQLRNTLSAAVAVLDEKLNPAPPKRKRTNKAMERFDEMYATGKWKKPAHLKKAKAHKVGGKTKVSISSNH